jgi:hypothetical protein
MENPLNQKLPVDYLRFYTASDNKILRGECDYPGCAKRFYHSLLGANYDEHRVAEQLADQHFEHMKKEHGFRA